MLPLLIASLVVALGIGSGAIPREQALPIGFTLLGSVAFVANLNRLGSLSFAQFSMVGILFLHSLNLARDVNMFLDLSIVDAGRLPLSMMVAVPVLLMGWRGLISGPGFAALSAPVVFLSWALLASGFGIDPAHSYFYGGWILFMCLLISVTRGLHTNPESFWDDWLLGMVSIGVFASVLSIMAIIFDLPGARFQRWVINPLGGSAQEVPGFCGIFENANTLSSVSMLGLAGAIALPYLRGGKRPKWLELTLGICGLSVLLSGSRAGILGLLSTGACYLWLLRPMQSGNTEQLSRTETRKKFLTPVLLLLCLFVFALSAVGSVGLQRLSISQESVGGGDIRQEVWASFARGMLERPLFGHGFQAKPMQDEWETLRLMPSQVAKGAHSAPIAYGTTTGVIGLLLFLWMLWGGFRGLLRPGHKLFAQSAVVFWLSCCPIYLLYAHGNQPSAPAVWPLWVLLLACRSVNGQVGSDSPAPPWVLRISRQEEKEFRAALPPFSVESFGKARSLERQATKENNTPRKD
jgi:hypothetical protein